MERDLAEEIAALQDMTVPQLRRKYWEVFEEETTSKHKAYLRKRIAWGLQAKRHGGLTKICLEKIEEHADLRLLRIRLPEGSFERIAEAVGTVGQTRIPLSQQRQAGLEPGAVLTRMHKGVEHRVEVLATGFRYGEQTYRSLSAVARAITGTNWNGKVFFGLKKKEGDR